MGRKLKPLGQLNTTRAEDILATAHVGADPFGLVIEGVEDGVEVLVVVSEMDVGALGRGPPVRGRPATVTARPIATTFNGNFAAGTIRARPILPSNRSASSGSRTIARSARASSLSR